MNKLNASGFTLVEVLVAMAIVALGFSALFELQSQGFRSLIKSGRVAKQILVEKQIVQHITLLNPADKPQGEDTVMDVSYSWQARQIIAPAQVRDPAEFAKRKVALFEIVIKMRDANGRQSQLTLQQIGWYSE
jgi:prepilin-type N-terminal cleavage/methylation domain-containing protein